MSPAGAPGGEVLADPALDRRLRDEGYVVVDLLSPDEVDRLRAAWDAFHAAHELAYDPVGLATSLRHPGLQDEADAMVRPLFEPAIRSLLPGRAPFMSVFVTKSPWSAALPDHIDWQMVDDGTVRTHGCWSPLEDSSPEHGALGVVPGSHRHVDFDRTPEDPGHEWAARYVAGGAPRRVLEVRAGQVVVYDHRLIHFSEPNRSDRIRVAVNNATAPATLAAHARHRLVSMMARGMAGAAGGPQIPGYTGG